MNWRIGGLYDVYNSNSLISYNSNRKTQNPNPLTTTAHKKSREMGLRLEKEMGLRLEKETNGTALGLATKRRIKEKKNGAMRGGAQGSLRSD